MMMLQNIVMHIVVKLFMMFLIAGNNGIDIVRQDAAHLVHVAMRLLNSASMNSKSANLGKTFPP
jgi:hypothetical protein